MTLEMFGPTAGSPRATSISRPLMSESWASGRRAARPPGRSWKPTVYSSDWSSGASNRTELDE